MENQNQTPVIIIKEGTHFRIPQGRKLNNRKVILENRTMEFTKVSKTPGMVNGFLTHPKTGKLLKTEISIPLELLEEIEDGILIFPLEVLETPVVVKKSGKKVG